jgi:hypothetical protein
MYKSLSYIICIARVFDDHRSCQKLINYITNIKAKSKRYHWIQKIPVLKRLFIQNLCKRSRCLEENPVFLFLLKKNNINEKREFSWCLQVVFDCRSFPIWNLKLKELSWFFCSCKRYTLLNWKGKCTECIVIDSVISHAKKK